MTQLFSDQPGPLPLSATYTTSQGGTLMIEMSGSAYGTAWSQTIGMDLLIDGVRVGSARSFTNEPWSHKAFVSGAIVVSNLPAGQHTLTLVQTSTATNMRTDFNDYYDMTVIEVVPATD